MPVALSRPLSRIARGLTAPFLPEDYLDYLAPLRGGAPLRARVVSVRELTSASAELTLRPGRGWAGHHSGQYLGIGVDLDGRRHWRTYSLTSHVGAPLVQIAVKEVSDGRVSPFLVRRLRPGQLVYLAQAQGDFILPVPWPRKLLLVSGGSGITPIIGMLRNHDFTGSDVVHLHGDADLPSIMFGYELCAPRAGVVSQVCLDEQGITPDKLAQLVPDFAEREVWMCGPTPMIEGLLPLFEASERSHAVHLERFTPTFLKTAAEGGEATVRSAQGNKTFLVDGATTLLDAAEEAGVQMNSGCRMGICFSCVVQMTDGAVRDLRTGELTSTSTGQPAVSIQPCVNAVAGACTITRE